LWQAGAAFNPVSDVLGGALTLSTAGVVSSFVVKASTRTQRHGTHKHYIKMDK
jgi:hypothetical protein